MLIIKCECGKILESISPENILKSLTFICEIYGGRFTHRCNDCWIASNKRQAKINKILELK